MKYTLKKKIIGSTVLVVTLSLLVSGSFAYMYFFSVLKKQSIRDDRIKMQQTALQLNNFISDIQQFALNISMDFGIQDTLKQPVKPTNVIEELRTTEKIISPLLKFNSMRDYLHSSSLITHAGKVYWTGAPLDDLFQSELKDEWYVKFETSGKTAGFTNIHELPFRGTKQKS